MPLPLSSLPPEQARHLIGIFCDLDDTLTEAGRTLIAEVFPRQAAAITEEMGALEPAEQAALGQLCRKLGRKENVTR